MLGELIGESKGRLLGTRVLPTEGGLVKVELSCQGRGRLLGADTGTYWQAIKPGGVLYGEGHVLMMAKDGAVADWTGYGLGSPAGGSLRRLRTVAQRA